MRSLFSKACCWLFGASVALGAASTAHAQVGACCIPPDDPFSIVFGECASDFPREFCEQIGGIYRGDNTRCEDLPRCAPFPAPTGACCFSTPTGFDCEVLTLEACDARGGSWKGPRTTCDDSTICLPPPPTGACCFRLDDLPPGFDSICFQTTEEQCVSTGGTFRGLNSTCDLPCPPGPPATGACCVPTDTGFDCFERQTLEECNARGGQWKGWRSECGDGTICLPPPPSGACCVRLSDLPGLDQILCVQASRENCESLSGLYRGDNTLCDPLTPFCEPLPIRVADCPADRDDGSGTGQPDGAVSIEDLLYFLPLFESGSIAADYDDGSGTGRRDWGVTIDDLLYFLSRFERGC